MTRTAPIAAVAAVTTAAALTLAACAAAPRPPERRAPTLGGWTLAWHDEFDGPAGARPDSARWVADTGGHGWGNRELQRYTTSPANAALDGRGHLVLTATTLAGDSAGRCWYGPCRYASARLTTRGRFAQAYGRFEARLRLPRGQGIWPAFWMLGADFPSVGWPASGEIDVVENVGSAPAVVHGTLHGPGHAGARGLTATDTLASGAWADDFHVWAVEWEPGAIRWLVDGRVFARRTPADLPAGARWVYDHPFFLLLNLAVGGDWPGSPDATTVLPQQLVVDHVRVWRRSGAPPAGAAGGAQR